MVMSYTELREAIVRSRSGQERWRCPAELREQIVRFTRECQRDGIAAKTVAKELGISDSGLSRWLQAADKRLRPVRITEAAASPRPEPLVLVTPGGYRLEGLRVDSAQRRQALQRAECPAHRDHGQRAGSLIPLAKPTSARVAWPTRPEISDTRDLS